MYGQMAFKCNAVICLKEYAYSATCVSDMENGCVGDMAALGITESFKVKRQVVISGAEAAEMILRVDDIIRQAPRQRGPDHCM